MEPKLPTPDLGPERVPSDYGQNREQGPSFLNPEIGLERGVEQAEQRSEATPVAVNAAPALPSPIAIPAPSLPVDETANDNVGDNNPSIAGDDDVIEKEWVDKAKKIINETKEDPHRREQEVAKLQIDYLRKRYGKELGSVDV